MGGSQECSQERGGDSGDEGAAYSLALSCGALPESCSGTVRRDDDDGGDDVRRHTPHTPTDTRAQATDTTDTTDDAEDGPRNQATHFVRGHSGAVARRAERSQDCGDGRNRGRSRHKKNGRWTEDGTDRRTYDTSERGEGDTRRREHDRDSTRFHNLVNACCSRGGRREYVRAIGAPRGRSSIGG